MRKDVAFAKRLTCPIRTLSGIQDGQDPASGKQRPMPGAFPSMFLCELPSTYHPYGLLEVGASRVILSHDRKLTELTLLFREFVFS